jgi:hypothetical protein
MKKVTHILLIGTIGIATAAAGCSSSSGNSKGSGGSSGSGGSGAGVKLMPDNTGWVDGSTNNIGVQGAWYAYGDGTDGMQAMGNGTCQMKGMHPDSACSSITTPVPGSMMFMPSDMATGKMCTSGMVNKVIDIVGMTGMPDYSNIWGAGIGIDLNSPGGGAPKALYDATAHHVTGISFDIDMVPAPKLRVEVATKPTDGTDAGNNFWGASSSYPPSPVDATKTNVVMWADFKGPKDATLKVDETMIESIQFHVPTVVSAAAPYSFCISNLTLLTSAD